MKIQNMCEVLHSGRQQQRSNSKSYLQSWEKRARLLKSQRILFTFHRFVVFSIKSSEYIDEMTEYVIAGGGGGDKQSDRETWFGGWDWLYWFNVAEKIAV